MMMRRFGISLWCRRSLRLSTETSPVESTAWLHASARRGPRNSEHAAASFHHFSKVQQWHMRAAMAQATRGVHGLAALGAHDTIFALSTVPGRSGVAVIRISGPEAAAAICTLTGRSSPPAARVATVRELRDPRTQQVLDMGIVIYFEGPKSFSGEDSAELQVHGSPAVVEEVLDCLSQIPSLRPALPGEFTRRAVLNGKLGLLEAEGLADLIAADTSIQRRIALQQLSGVATVMYDKWREELIKCLAHVEAFIDFGEDDEVGSAAVQGARDRAAVVLGEIQALERSDRCGEVLRTGVEVVLTGPPNAGKSSLLNLLSQRQAATSMPFNIGAVQKRECTSEC